MTVRGSILVKSRGKFVAIGEVGDTELIGELAI